MPLLIDLSHPLEDGQPVYPSDPEIRVQPHGSLAEQGYHITRLSLSTHQGTHLDAPFHFFDDGPTIDQLPLEACYGPASLIDLAPGGELPPDAAITPALLEPHAAAFAPGARVLYRTGWDRRFGTPAFFEHFPSLTREAAQWIAQRRIALLGMDTPGPSQDWQAVHRTLLGPEARIVLLESLAHLDRLPPQFTLAALGLKIRARDGSPVRAIAIVNP